MTNSEKQFAELGYEYATNIEQSKIVHMWHNNREIRKVGEKWEVQPLNDNYWLSFDNLIDAIRCGHGIEKEAP